MLRTVVMNVLLDVAQQLMPVEHLTHMRLGTKEFALKVQKQLTVPLDRVLLRVIRRLGLLCI